VTTRCAIVNLDHFIADCRAVLAERSPEASIKELVARAVAEPAQVEAVLGTPRQGEITTLHHSPELTVLNVIWTPGMAIYPHDHRMWTVIGLYGGQEDNTFYRRGPGGLAVAGGKQLGVRDVAVLGQAVIHSVANPLRVFTGAIHVYGGDFFGTPRSEWTPDTLQERPFDMERARRVYADANARWRAQCAGAADHPFGAVG
jgi:predicted metal-dependent enzyme (double-stranded beta helix superfamily)